MRPLVTPEAMQRSDRAAIASGTTAQALMEIAGRFVAAAAIRVAGGRYGRRAVVVCGKGSNGGDGLVAARVLAREGLDTRCLLVEGTASIPVEARPFVDALERSGVAVQAFDAGALADADVVVDAIFGTGFRGRPEGAAARAIDGVNAGPSAVVAVDIPSGIDGLTGAAPGSAVRAGVTVAMAAEKIGTATGPGAEHAGTVEVVDIGVPLIEDPTVWMLEEADVARAIPPARASAHKRSRGWVALVAGSDEMPGAVALAAEGAMRAGAGYVSILTTDVAKAAVLERLPEAVVASRPQAGLDAQSVADFGALARATCVATGPGMGRGSRQAGVVRELVRSVEAPLVLDADALEVVSDADILTGRRGPVIVTPHPGEMAEMRAITVGDVQSDRVGAARAAAGKLDCVVLLKGFRTVIADPGGSVVVNPAGGPELATAGTGDVLTGVLAAMAAAGIPAFEAAQAAAFVHGRAGELAGAGAVASDVAATVPIVVADLRGRYDPVGSSEPSGKIGPL